MFDNICLGCFVLVLNSPCSLTQYSMPQSIERIPWWDKEVDEAGRVIRADVRSAAVRVWEKVVVVVMKIRGDDSEASEILDEAVAAISFYLNKKGIGPGDPGGLLIKAVSRIATHRARRERRIRAIGGTTELDELLSGGAWVESIERKLVLEKIVVALPPATQAILRLRLKDMSWKEIGRLVGLKPSIVRSRFWQDVRRAYLAVLAGAKPDDKK
jgi:DNA-directed RNA polymerase specialized sigma24 family protein